MTEVHYELHNDCEKHKTFILSDTTGELCAVHGTISIPHMRWVEYVKKRKEFQQEQDSMLALVEESVHENYQQRVAEFTNKGQQYCPHCSKEMQHQRASNYYCNDCKKNVSVMR